MMIHFAGNPQCPQLQGGGQLSSASTHEEYRKIFDLTPIPDRYCKICVSIQAPRTDADRYAELRALVEAYQNAKSYEDDAPLQALRDWSHR